MDFSSSAQGRPTVTQLLGDGEVLANAVEYASWSDRRVQPIVCAACGIEGCEPGGWVAPRATDDAVLWLPAFDDMDEELGNERGPPDYFAKRGIPLFGHELASELCRLVAGFPSCSELPTLSWREAVLVMQWMAPRKVLGAFGAAVRARSDDVVAVSSGERDRRLQELERLLGRELATGGDARWRAREPGDEVIEFYLDGPGHVAWSPLAVVAGAVTLHVDGLVAV